MDFREAFPSNFRRRRRSLSSSSKKRRMSTQPQPPPLLKPPPPKPRRMTPALTQLATTPTKNVRKVENAASTDADVTSIVAVVAVDDAVVAVVVDD